MTKKKSPRKPTMKMNPGPGIRILVSHDVAMALVGTIGPALARLIKSTPIGSTPKGRIAAEVLRGAGLGGKVN